MTDTEKFNTFLNMRNRGGSFASSLAEAWFMADSGNKATLETAFAPLIQGYSLPPAFEVDPDSYRCVRVWTGALFEDEEFVRWVEEQIAKSQIATWHRKGQIPGEFSDIFMTVDSLVDGSNSDMPVHCWQMLMEALSRAGVSDDEAVLVWLINR